MRFLAKFGDINPFCYISSHNHGTQKWIPPVVVTFQIYLFSSMFHFHDYGKTSVFVKKRWCVKGFPELLCLVQGPNSSPFNRCLGQHQQPMGNYGWLSFFYLHPRKLTWNLKMMVSNQKNILSPGAQGSIFKFLVIKVQGWTSILAF